MTTTAVPEEQRSEVSKAGCLGRSDEAVDDDHEKTLL